MPPYLDDFCAVAEMNLSDEKDTAWGVVTKTKTQGLGYLDLPTDSYSWGVSDEAKTASLGNDARVFEVLTSTLISNQRELRKPSRPQTPRNASVVNSDIALQKWEGYVLEISAENFTARLTDLTAQGAKEDAEFNISELSQDDLSLLEQGAVFYWTIGRQTDSTNRQRMVSEIRFRRLPNWTEDELTQAALEANKLAINFGIK